MFRSPIRLDLSPVRRPVPSDWQHELKQESIDTFPLVAGDGLGHEAGWTSYVASLNESPECEILSGGINTKTASAAALWRQGHLLHFGFQCAPAEMNAFGRGLLVNSIAYIARFREDRPIANTVSVFAVERVAPRLAKLSEGDPPHRLTLEHWFPESFAAPRTAAAAGAEAWKQWVAAHGIYLRPGAEGYLEPDEDLIHLQVQSRDPRLFDVALTELAAGGARAERAFRLLHRYSHSGPKDSHLEHALAAWKPWLHHNRPFLFFSETGGYLWYVDRLAQARSIPSARLRGPARADLK